ncbi:MAG: SRPBCC family protein [Gemmatimonadota bacterium]
MIKQLLLVVLGIVAIIALRALFIPGSFRVERSVMVKASPEQIFPLLNDFQQFGRWSPWEKLDPAMERQVSTPSAGPGAVYEWRGNAKAGAGRMEILQAVPSQSVRVKLDFLKPFESHNTTDYTLTPAGDSTRVTWAMYGPSTFPSKVMQVFVSMDKMIGGDFDRGLASIKSIAEQ